MSEDNVGVGPNRVMWCGTLGLALSPESCIDGAEAAGYNHVSLSPNSMRDMSAAELKAVAEYGRQRGVQTSVARRLHPWRPITDPRVAAFAADFDQLRRLIEGLGAELVNVLSLADGVAPEDQIEPFAEVCDALADVGARASLEFTPLGGVQTLADGLQVVRGADRPNGGLLFDTWHFTKGGPDRELLARTDARWIKCVQISDAVLDTQDSLWRDTFRYRRHPGDGQFDLAPLMRQLRDQGMLDWYGPEVISLEQHALSPQDAGRLAGRRLEEFLASALAVAD